jgi:hypothetical protein
VLTINENQKIERDAATARAEVALRKKVRNQGSKKGKKGGFISLSVRNGGPMAQLTDEQLAQVLNRQTTPVPARRARTTESCNYYEDPPTKAD